jgi:bifunctional non-homologous end joining protein LigD
LKSHPVEYHMFDVMHADGYDVTQLPLLSRKQLLRDVVSPTRRIKVVKHKKEKGEEYFTETCARPGAEGIIAKRATSVYSGKRSRDWLKFKCASEQEFVVGGWTEPQGSRTGLGALLVGYYDRDGTLRYAGKVGTGFDRAMLDLLTKELKPLAVAKPPFVDEKLPRHAHWVKPKLVVQIGFGEWTDTQRLRHPRFLGIRRDKKPREVVRETPSDG